MTTWVSRGRGRQRGSRRGGAAVWRGSREGGVENVSLLVEWGDGVGLVVEGATAWISRWSLVGGLTMVMLILT